MWIDDQIIEKSSASIVCQTWCPQGVAVVLGSNNSFEKECYESACKVDGIPVLRRLGGGGAVVLSKECVVISLGCWVRDYFRNDVYFDKINKAIISVMRRISSVFGELYQNGISDICYGDKKVGGTSLFRSRNFLLYQGSLLYSVNHLLINKYLRHPTKEPNYRKNKQHSDFLFSLSEIASDFTQKDITSALSLELEGQIKKTLESDLISSQDKQLFLLKKRRLRDHVISAI